MKKYNVLSLSLLLLCIAVAPGYSQDEAANQGAPIAGQEPPEDTSNLPVVANDPEAISQTAGNAQTAEEELVTILLDDFETPQNWNVNIPLDFGISRMLYRDGAPQEIQADNNKTILGVKVHFFRRNFGWMSVDKQYPIAIRNIVKSFSTWVQGRDRRHKLYFKVRDINANHMRILAGEGDMMWRGWKKVIAPVSDNVIQYNPIRNNKGLEFLGFHIAFEAEDVVTTEPYYIYFDYLTAVINKAQSPEMDEIMDDW